MFGTSIALLFLIPGLAAYAAIYGIFHDGKRIAPEPPGANTVEAVIIIAGVSVVVHAATSSLFALDRVICHGGCPLTVRAGWVDPYGSAIKAVTGHGIGGTALSLALLAVCGQAAVIYWGIRWRLTVLARSDRLPAWIYGWATLLADGLDNQDTAVLAYVLTTSECGGKALAYGGLVHDIALKPDGSVTRITLTDCERYLVDLMAPADENSLSDALSSFSFMVIDAAHIRNIAFETIDVPSVA